ncbi:Membrane protein involved in the export of O-antigen and teichoic acid [Alteromonadaceae bacterium Bs31]|nr:Membrane protein involved in the export of O-antigen and teichoic acid [Alteromonadaceae bacterium Bs31]
MVLYARSMKLVISFSLVTLVVSVVTFSFIPVIARLLSISEFGRFSLYYTVVLNLTPVILFGASTKLTIARSGGLSSRQISVFFGWLSSGVVVTVILCFFLTGVVWEGVPILILLALCRAGFLMHTTQLRLDERLVQFCYWQLSVVTLSFLVPISFMILFEIRVLEFVGLMIPAYLVSILFFFRANVFGREMKWDWGQMFPLVVFGAGAASHSLVGALLTSGGRYVSVVYLGAEEVGVYMLAAQLVAIITLLFSTVIQNVTPEFYRKLNKYSEGQVLKSFVLKLCISVAVVIFFFWLSLDWVVHLFFPVEYYGAVAVAKIMAIGAGFQGGYMLLSNYVFFKGRSFSMAGASSIVGVLGLAAGTALSSCYGLTGLAVAYVIGWCLLFVVVGWLALRLAR